MKRKKRNIQKLGKVWLKYIYTYIVYSIYISVYCKYHIHINNKSWFNDNDKKKEKEMKWK